MAANTALTRFNTYLLPKRLKYCNSCGGIMPVSNFAKHKKHTDGRSSQCRLCVRENNRTYYKNNTPEILAQVKQYQEEHSAEISARKQRHYESNKEEILEANRQNYQARRDHYYINSRVKKYNLTREEYMTMVVRQHNRCAACDLPEIVVNPSGQIKALSIDHNHKTGQVRALLCSRCNLLLGLSLEDPETLRTLAGYLEEFSDNLS